MTEEERQYYEEIHTLKITIGNEEDNFEELKSTLVEFYNYNDYLLERENIDSNESKFYETEDDDIEIRDFTLKLLNDKLKKSITKNTGQKFEENDFSAHIIDYQIKEGSLTILATIALGVLYSFEKYGALRQSYDYFVKDVTNFFSPISHHKEVKVSTSKNPDPIEINSNLSFLDQLKSTNIFWSLSGASIILLKRAYTDQNRYKNIGAAILFTSIFAFISASFTLSFLTKNLLVIFPVSLLWAVTILNIDMLMISSMLKYENNRWRSLKGFIVRFILAIAIAIAIAISVPVEMILLGDEIKDEIIRYHREFVDKEIGNSRQFIELNRNIKTEISNKEKLQVRFKNEMQGREGSVYGYGYISKKIEEQFLKAEKKVDSLINEKNEVFSILENRIFAEQNT